MIIKNLNDIHGLDCLISDFKSNNLSFKNIPEQFNDIPDNYYGTFEYFYKLTLINVLSTIHGRLLLLAHNLKKTNLLAFREIYNLFLQSGLVIYEGSLLYTVLLIRSSIGLQVQPILDGLNLEYKERILAYSALISDLRAKGFNNFYLEYFFLLGATELAIDFHIDKTKHGKGMDLVYEIINDDKINSSLSIPYALFVDIKDEEINLLLNTYKDVFMRGEITQHSLRKIIYDIKKMLVKNKFPEDFILSDKEVEEYLNSMILSDDSLTDNFSKRKNAYIPHGFIVPGNLPSIIDPEFTSNNNVDESLIHEYSHYRLLNNTIWGYLTIRLNELKDIFVEEFYTQYYLAYKEIDSKYDVFYDRKKYFELLMQRSNPVLEGHAVTNEFMLNKEYSSPFEWKFDGIPSDYIEYTAPFHEIALYMHDRGASGQMIKHIIEAAAEVTLDISFHKEIMEFADFPTLVKTFLMYEDYNEILYCASKVIYDYFIEKKINQFQLLLNSEKVKDRNFSRKLLEKIKKEIHSHLLIGENKAQFLDDLNTKKIINQIDYTLSLTFPLRRFRHVEKGASNLTSLIRRNPDFLIEKENLNIEDFVSLSLELKQHEGYVMTTVMSVEEDEGFVLDLVSMVITNGGTTLVFDRNIFTDKVPLDKVLQYDRDENSLVWLFPLNILDKREYKAIGFGDDRSNLIIVGLENILQLNNPVYFFYLDDKPLDVNDLIDIFGCDPIIKEYIFEQEPDTRIVELSFKNICIFFDMHKDTLKHVDFKNFTVNKKNIFENIYILCAYFRYRNTSNFKKI